MLANWLARSVISFNLVNFEYLYKCSLEGTGCFVKNFLKKNGGIIDRIKGVALRYEDYIGQIRLPGKATFAICLITRNERRIIVLIGV